MLHLTLLKHQHIKRKEDNMKKWFICPYCKKKLVKYEKDAISKSVFLLCKKCGKEVEIKINKE